MDKQTFQSYGTNGLLAPITSAAEGLAAGLMSLFGAAVREPLRVLSCLIMACFLYGIIRSKPILPQPGLPVAIERRHGQFSTSNVCFHYNPSQLILRNINLDIPFGRAIAILGANGSGKSTLIQLLGRYYDPVEGNIEFDGIDIRRIATHDIRNRIACVSQSTELFNRTVFENIQ